jgi:hypothetical protein
MYVIRRPDTRSRKKGAGSRGAKHARPGTRVRVQECPRRPTFEGLEGTITQRFGGDKYVAFEVRLDGGGRELFRPHELEETRDQSLWLKLWYASR